MAFTFGKKEEVYGFQTLYREIGYYINRLEQYERALKFFNQAVEKTPNDKRALLGRAWARSKAAQYEGALKDVRKALELDQDDLTILYPKALNTYLSCEFEDGLVQNTRLIPKRSKPDHFVMGVMHCTDAIENCVGERTGRPLRDHFKIIRRLAWKKYYEAQKPYVPKSKFRKKKKKKEDNFTDFAPVSKVPKSPKPDSVATEGSRTDHKGLSAKSSRATTQEDEESECIRNSLYSHESEKNLIPRGQPYPYRPLQNYTTNIRNYMAEKYLDSMYLDKIFLENLIYEPGVRGPNKNGTKKILQAAKNGYKALCYKQELLRTRRPFYYLKFQEATVTGALKARQEEAAIKLRETAKREIEQLKTKLVEAVQKKNLRTVLELAEKVKTYCDSKPKRILPDREKYYTIVYDSVCQAHYDTKRLNINQSPMEQEKRIHVMFGIQLSREPSCDSVITQFKGVFLDWRKQIAIYEERLRKATNSPEMAWLYHELARFYIETKQYEMARVYARKCINEGLYCDNPKWIVNSQMLITKVNICQQNRNDAKLEIHKAAEIARNTDDDVLLDYLEKCLYVVEKIEFDDLHGPKILERREKKILDMIDHNDLKAEAAHLFSVMQAMPAHRRMFVMPGVKMDPAEEAFKEKATRRASIMPGAAKKDEGEVKQLRKNAPSGKPGQAQEGGVGFMNLIQYHVE